MVDLDSVPLRIKIGTNDGASITPQIGDHPVTYIETHICCTASSRRLGPAIGTASPGRGIEGASGGERALRYRTHHESAPESGRLLKASIRTGAGYSNCGLRRLASAA